MNLEELREYLDEKKPVDRSLFMADRFVIHDEGSQGPKDKRTGKAYISLCSFGEKREGDPFPGYALTPIEAVIEYGKQVEKFQKGVLLWRTKPTVVFVPTEGFTVYSRVATCTVEEYEDSGLRAVPGPPDPPGGKPVPLRVG